MSEYRTTDRLTHIKRTLNQLDAMAVYGTKHTSKTKAMLELALKDIAEMQANEHSESTDKCSLENVSKPFCTFNVETRQFCSRMPDCKDCNFRIKIDGC